MDARTNARLASRRHGVGGDAVAFETFLFLTMFSQHCIDLGLTHAEAEMILKQIAQKLKPEDKAKAAAEAKAEAERQRKAVAERQRKAEAEHQRTQQVRLCSSPDPLTVTYPNSPEFTTPQPSSAG